MLVASGKNIVTADLCVASSNMTYKQNSELSDGKVHTFGD
jgi:hypothetical protein